MMNRTSEHILLQGIGSKISYSSVQKSVALQPGVLTSPNANAYIDSSTPTTTPPLGNFLFVGDVSPAVSVANRTLLKFDLSSAIPSSAVIDSATLSLYEFSAIRAIAGPTTWAVEVRRLLKNWVHTQVTATRYSTGNNWDSLMANTDGVDRSADISASVTLDGTAASAMINFTSDTLTNDVRGFIKGTIPNYGWLILAPTAEYPGVSDRSGTYFSSVMTSTVARRPTLTIVYRERSYAGV